MVAQKGNRENTTPENSFIICKGIVKFALRRSRVAGENGGVFNVILWLGKLLYHEQRKSSWVNLGNAFTPKESRYLRMKGKEQVKGFKPYNGSYFLYRSLGSETDLTL